MWRISLLLILALPSPSFGFSRSDPERHNVFSPNRAHVLDVNPKTNLHVLYSTWDRSQPLWTIEKQIDYHDFFV